MSTLTLDVRRTHGTFSAAGEVGDPVDVAAWGADKSVQFAAMQLGTFSDATLRLEGSLDGVEYNAIGSDVTFNSTVPFVGIFNWIRVHTVAHGGANTPVVTLSGHVRPL